MFISLATHAVEYGVNLVQNGGAELTPFNKNGWVISSGNWGTRNYEPKPAEGRQYFYAKNSNSDAAIYQKVDLTPYSATIAAGIQYLQITSIMAAWDNKDGAQQVFTFENKGGGGIAYYKTGTISSKQTWKHFNTIVKVPKDAVRLRIKVQSFRRSGGNNDGYHDDIKVVALNPKDYQSRELLFNGSGEMGSFKTYGWKQESGSWDRRYSDPSAKHGSSYFYCKNSYGAIYQDVDVSEFAETIDQGIQEFRYRGYQSGWNGVDSSEVNVYFMSAPDDNGKIHSLGNSYSSGRVFSSKRWIKKETTRVAPIGTRTIRVRLRAFRKDQWFNNNNDGYIDAMSLVYLPVDRDGDGLPNVKESAWGLNPDDPSDGALDLDGDGFSNQQEYIAGTDVNGATDYPALHIKSFHTDKAQISELGESVNLGWDVWGATRVDLYQGDTLLQAYDASSSALWQGEWTVSPEKTTAYRLIVSDGEKTRESDAVVRFQAIQKVTIWPESLADSHPYLLDSLTLMSDGSHVVSLTDGSYAFFTQQAGNKVLNWQQENIGQVSHKALLLNGYIIIGSDSVSQSQGKVLALSKTGEIQWSFTTDYPVKARPVTDSQGKTVYAIDYYGKVYALDALSGVLLWSYQLPGEDVVVINEPALKSVITSVNTLDLDQSRLLVRTTSNQLFAIALNAKSNPLIWVKNLSSN